MKVTPSALATVRLPRMSALLRRDAANPTGVKFDLGTWAEPADDGRPMLMSHEWSTEEGFKVPLDCNTKACAFGLGAISGEFTAEGLTYLIGTGHNGLPIGSLTPLLVRPGEKPDAQMHPTHFNAACELFGIDSETARYFFDPDCYSGVPKEAEGELQVAQRIDEYLMGEVDADYHPDYRDSGDGYDDEDCED